MNKSHNTIAIIKYNAGNSRSVLFALERLGVPAKVTNNHQEIKQASHVIFPGVGAANSAMPYLKEHGLHELIPTLTQPFLGICLGMQLMCKHSEEGNTDCMNIFDLSIKKFYTITSTSAVKIKVPHTGWNGLTGVQSALLDGLKENEYCYFVHSYYASLGKATIATTDYHIPFSSAVQKDNFFGVQFHPEKSAKVGERILANFLNL